MALDFNAFQMGQQAVGDPVAEAMQRQQGMLQLQAGGLNNQAAAQQLQMQRIALQRQQTFGQDMQNFLQSPSAKGVASLFGKYPEFNKQISDSWNTIDVAQRRSDATTLGSVASLVAKGDYDNAGQLIQTRIDADKAAGRDSSSDEQALSMLKSGDPKQQKAVLGLATIEAAGAVGPDKAGEFLKSLGLSGEPLDVGPGHRLITQQGQTVAAVPSELKDVSWTDAQGVTHPGWFDPQTGAMGNPGTAPGASPGTPSYGEGGGQASGAGPTAQPPAGGGMVGSVNHVLTNEGGLNKSDMNGSPTNFGINYAANRAELAKVGITSPSQMGNLTKDQAAQIYAAKYWPQSGAEKLPSNLQAPYFDVYVRSPKIAKQALAQSGGDPAKFAQITNAYFQNMAANNPKAAVYAHAWATRDAGNAAIATGQVPNAVPTAGGGQASAAVAPSFGPGSAPSAIPNTKNAEPGFKWDSTGAEVPIGGGTQDLPPQMVDDMARTLLETGQLPQGMGMGGASLKKAVFARRSEIMQQNGITADQLPALQARNAADKSAYSNITGIANGLSASKATLFGNLNQVWETQKPLIKDGILGSTPFLNEQKLKYYTQFGTPQQKQEIAQYRLAINGATTDYAKFMSTQTGMGNAPSTDSARSQAGDLLDEAQPMTVIRGSVKQLMKEAEIKEAGIYHQKTTLEQKLASYPWANRSATGGGPAQISNLQQYTALPHGAQYIDPNGVHRVKS